MQVYRDSFRDDFIIEPYVTVNCTYTLNFNMRWGIYAGLTEKKGRNQAAAYNPTIIEESDFYAYSGESCHPFRRKVATFSPVLIPL
jgi:hypothetical protein